MLLVERVGGVAASTYSSCIHAAAQPRPREAIHTTALAAPWIMTGGLNLCSLRGTSLPSNRRTWSCKG